MTGHLDQFGLGYKQDGDKIVVKEDGEPVLWATFVEQGQMARLDVAVKRRQS